MSLHIPLLPKPVRWLPAGIVAGLICYWSLATAPPTITTLTIVPPSITPLETATTAGTGGITTGGFAPPSESISESSISHAIAYATLSVSLAYALADAKITLVYKAVLVLAVATGYGVLMEAGQSFQPERVPALADVLINALGAAAAVAWYRLERRATFVPVREFHRGVWTST